MARRLDIPAVADALMAGQRAALGRSITLVESLRPQDRDLAAELLTRIGPNTGNSHRIGISGVPGVGKSTFIERFGLHLISQGHRVAVLAVDPSSGRTGGSILGDKTRMEALAQHEMAFIRPSPSAGVLGGVARATRETISLVEAAGYDIVLVETVGTGQSETMVADLVDVFMVLMLPGAGDDLQGIKRGILELADLLVVNKVDKAKDAARHAIRDYRAALHILVDASPNWHPPVIPAAGLTGEGLTEVWAKLQDHKSIMQNSGEWQQRRLSQQQAALIELTEQRLLREFWQRDDVQTLVPELLKKVQSGHVTVTSAVEQLIKA